MQVSNLRVSAGAGVVRGEARVSWEETDRGPVDTWIEVSEQFADVLRADANGLALAAILPAWHGGECRLLVTGSICPVLRDNLSFALSTLRGWYPEMGSPPALEATDGFVPVAHAGDQSASFLSGGIDSLATLRSNRMALPASHPYTIRAAILVDLIREPGLDELETAHQHAKRLSHASAIAADSGLDIISVRTNLLELDGDGWFFSYKWHGALWAAIAHLLSSRFQRVSIAASYAPSQQHPWGSHPFLDPYYSSGHLTIHHHGAHMSRFEKVALVADWPTGLQSILVCQGHRSGLSNCGACEKCIRTMTALVALGKLEACQCFPADDVTPSLLNTVMDYGMIYSPAHLDYYTEMVPALIDRGRADLAAVIQQFPARLAAKETVRPGNEAVAAVVPAGASVVVADPDQFGGVLPPEGAARYWASPADDTTAVRELEALRRSGAEYLVLVPKVFWWLDYYPALHQRLRTSYRCVVQTDHYQVFDLRSPAPDGTADTSDARGVA